MWQALKIEEMRIRLSGLVVAKNFNMQDTDVISLSRELDRLIVDFEKAKKRASRGADYTVEHMLQLRFLP